MLSRLSRSCSGIRFDDCVCEDVDEQTDTSRYKWQFGPLTAGGPARTCKFVKTTEKGTVGCLARVTADGQLFGCARAIVVSIELLDKAPLLVVLNLAVYHKNDFDVKDLTTEIFRFAADNEFTYRRSVRHVSDPLTAPGGPHPSCTGSYSFLMPPIIHMPSQLFEMVWTMTPVSSYSQNLLPKLFQNADYSDVVFKVSDEEIPAHRCIVCSRSSAMADLLRTKDDDEPVVIAEAKKGLFKELLRYMYTGEVEQMDKFAVDLAKMAMANDIHELLVKCQAYLVRHFNEENVIESLAFADDYDLDDMKDAAMEYIRKHVETVVNQPQFLEFQSLHPQMVLELFLKLDKQAQYNAASHIS